MNLFNEAARMFFALFALILTTMLTQPMSFNLSPLGQQVALQKATGGLPAFNNFYVAPKFAADQDNSVTTLDESDAEAKAAFEARQAARANLKIAGLRPVYRARK